LDRCKHKDKIHFHEGVTEFKNEQGQSRLIILDDLLNEAYSTDVSHILPRGIIIEISS
jgi:hypothetical protein